jgi:hypothetical protein
MGGVRQPGAVDEDGQAFIVTARDMSYAEKKTFRTAPGWSRSSWPPPR